MKISHVSLAAFLIVFGTFVSAQSDAPIKPPADRGMARSPDSPMKTPSDPGIVVVPPKVDPDAVKTPPKNIDPEITDATKDVDRKNREKAEDKSKPRKRLKKPQATR